jgi:zinc ribbon protein/sporulation related protein
VSEPRCSNCGEPVDSRQLVCLNCGARVALRQPTPWAREPVTPVAALLVAVIVIGAALFGFAISELTSGDGDGGGEPARQGAATQAPAVVSGGEQEARTAPETQPSRGSDPLEGSAGRVPGWPDGLSAHTVVLLSSSDRGAALNVAKQARASGLEAGLIRSEPYNLGTGLWIVFSGQFTTPEGAQRQAAQLADRYPGAYPQLVQKSQ